MVLRAKDLLVALKLASDPERSATQAEVAHELGLTQSQVYYALVNLAASGLYNKALRRISRPALEEFLVHGVKYVFPAQHGGLTRGLPTAYAAPPLRDHIRQPDEPPPVWPSPTGSTRGLTFEPIDDHVPEAASRDPKLYELLVLVDALRDGRAREKELAIKELKARL